MQSGTEIERKMSEKNRGFKMEWNQSGIGTEMEMEWIFTTKKVDDGMEMEWKFCYKRDRCKMEGKWNGNGMEIKWK